MLKNQPVIPAINSHQSLKIFLKLNVKTGIIMNFQLAQLEEIITIMHNNNKKVLVHLELIKGLANDEYGAIYLIQNLKVDGIISTKPKVISLCKKRGVIGILRFFLKDKHSLYQSIEIVKKANPDYLEVLPALPESLDLLKNHFSCPIILGGLIQTKAQVKSCLDHGAFAITTSLESLWQ